MIIWKPHSSGHGPSHIPRCAHKAESVMPIRTTWRCGVGGTASQLTANHLTLRRQIHRVTCTLPLSLGVQVQVLQSPWFTRVSRKSSFLFTFLKALFASNTMR